METIAAIEAKTRLSELLDRTSHGEAFEITRHGHPIARLVPINTGHDREAARAAVERLIAMTGFGGKMTAAERKAIVHEGHRY